MKASASLSRRRPRTLHEVSIRTIAGEDRFDPALREFLDSFYADPPGREAAIAARPELISPLEDAYLAAVAEHLAAVFHLPCPAWTERHGRELRKPFFAGGLQSAKARLTVESPAAFRRRMLFVSHDALSRPRLPPATDTQGAELDPADA